MTRRALVVGVLLAAALALPAAVPAYPPITCGRTTIHGTVYVVRTHGPKCGFATKWVRTFAIHQRSPKGFRCRAYGAAVPANCINRKHRTSYFQATEASR